MRVKARELSSGALIGVARGDRGRIEEATVTLTLNVTANRMEVTLVFTLEYDYPFAIDSDREVEIRNG